MSNVGLLAGTCKRTLFDVWVVVALVCVLVCRAGAQDSTASVPSGWLVGASMGVPGYQGQSLPELFTIGLQWTQIDPNRLGADFAIGTMPRAVTNGLVVTGARAGVALPLALYPGVLLLPSVGVSLLGAVASGGGIGTAGFNVGAATVFHGAGSLGLRTGVTWHWFGAGDAAIWLLEVGFVHVPHSP